MSESEARRAHSSVYVDTSVLGRVVLEEPDKQAIQDALADFDVSIASQLLRVELRRLGVREDALAETDRLLDDVLLIPMDDRVLASAETITPMTVGTLDAIHLATAVRLFKSGELHALMTYDKRLAGGAREHGLEVLSPA